MSIESFFPVRGSLAFFNRDITRLGVVVFLEALAFVDLAGSRVLRVLEESLDSTLLREELAELWTELRSSRSLRSRCCATVSLAGSSHDTLNMLENVRPSMEVQQVETIREGI